MPDVVLRHGGHSTTPYAERAPFWYTHPVQVGAPVLVHTSRGCPSGPSMTPGRGGAPPGRGGGTGRPAAGRGAAAAGRGDDAGVGDAGGGGALGPLSPACTRTSREMQTLLLAKGLHCRGEALRSVDWESIAAYEMANARVRY